MRKIEWVVAVGIICIKANIYSVDTYLFLFHTCTPA